MDSDPLFEWDEMFGPAFPPPDVLSARVIYRSSAIVFWSMLLRHGGDERFAVYETSCHDVCWFDAAELPALLSTVRSLALPAPSEEDCDVDRHARPWSEYFGPSVDGHSFEALVVQRDAPLVAWTLWLRETKGEFFELYETPSDLHYTASREVLDAVALEMRGGQAPPGDYCPTQ